MLDCNDNKTLLRQFQYTLCLKIINENINWVEKRIHPLEISDERMAAMINSVRRGYFNPEQDLRKYRKYEY